MKNLGSYMTVPVVDLASILGHSDEDERKKAVNEFGEACIDFGILRIINHGLPDAQVNRSYELVRQFFDRPIVEKLDCKPVSTILPAGYGNMDSQFGSNEWLMVCQPCLDINVFPSNQPEVR
ncbi:flavanone 3-hydroxylase-like protein, partial [Tanacetum coccineum]